MPAFYENTPDEAARIGWKHLPEHCLGDATLPFVRHDPREGSFIYTAASNEDDFWKEERAFARSHGFEC